MPPCDSHTKPDLLEVEKVWWLASKTATDPWVQFPPIQVRQHLQRRFLHPPTVCYIQGQRRILDQSEHPEVLETHQP